MDIPERRLAIAPAIPEPHQPLPKRDSARLEVQVNIEIPQERQAEQTFYAQSGRQVDAYGPDVSRNDALYLYGRQRNYVNPFGARRSRYLNGVFRVIRVIAQSPSDPDRD